MAEQPAVGAAPGGGGPDAGGDPVLRGRDLARQALEQAKADARARARAGERGAAAARRRAVPRALPHDGGEPMAFGAAIERMLELRGWQTEAAVAGVLARWPELVGEDVAAHCSPASLRDGVLTVAAESSAWAANLSLLKGPLMDRLNADLGHGLVRKVVVRGPTAPSWSHGRRRVQGGRGPRDTYG